MLFSRIYAALLIGFGFTALVFAVLMSLGADLAFGMIGITLLMPGISLVQAMSRNCCKSPLPMLMANGLIFSAVTFIPVWLGTRNLHEKALRRFLRPLTLIVVGVVTLGWGAARALEWAWSAPSDETLAKLFNQHRSDLESLVSMSREDYSVRRIANDFIWPQDPEASSANLPEGRWNDYRTLFRKAGLTAGLQKDSHGNVYFIAHTEGTVVSGGSKGLVYCEKTQGSSSDFLPCTEQHDSGKFEDVKGRGSQYHRLTDHWYVYSDWD
jgi:hypothetical protein